MFVDVRGLPILATASSEDLHLWPLLAFRFGAQFRRGSLPAATCMPQVCGYNIIFVQTI